MEAVGGVDALGLCGRLGPPLSADACDACKDSRRQPVPAAWKSALLQLLRPMGRAHRSPVCPPFEQLAAVQSSLFGALAQNAQNSAASSALHGFHGHNHGRACAKCLNTWAEACSAKRGWVGIVGWTSCPCQLANVTALTH